MNARARRLSVSRTKYSSRPQYIIPVPCRAPEAGPTGAGTWVEGAQVAIEAGAIPDSGKVMVY